MVATVFHKIEAVVFFLAMMLAVVPEGGIVYWFFQHPAGQGSFGLTDQWTGAALPKGWLIGALSMLARKLIVMFTPSFGGAEGEVQREREDFLRLWRWTVALIAMQALAFFLDRVAAS